MVSRITFSYEVAFNQQSGKHICCLIPTHTTRKHMYAYIRHNNNLVKGETRMFPQKVSE
jgi:hypothetical protein